MVCPLPAASSKLFLGFPHSRPAGLKSRYIVTDSWCSRLWISCRFEKSCMCRAGKTELRSKWRSSSNGGLGFRKLEGHVQGQRGCDQEGSALLLPAGKWNSTNTISRDIRASILRIVEWQRYLQKGEGADDIEQKHGRACSFAPVVDRSYLSGERA